MLVISQEEVAALLDMPRCIALMRDTLAAVARGEVVLPLRTWLATDDGAAVLAMMPAYVRATSSLGVKVISAGRWQGDGSRDAHQGAVLLFDTSDGSLLAIADATAITAIRTAAVSAVATDVLANPDAADLALLGAGTQAATHLEAIVSLRKLSRVRVWSRSLDRATAFAQRASARHAIDVEVADSAHDATSGASIICTVTSSPTPVLQRSWVSDGAHINAVGSSVLRERELDGATIAASELFVDRRESAVNEAGDLLLAIAEGAVTSDHIRAELGDVIVGRARGRSSPTSITVFKSLGLAAEDVAAMRAIYERARDERRGTEVDLGGRRHMNVALSPRRD